MTITLAKALAGHAARTERNPRLNAKAKQYDNALTDLVNAVIAEQTARLTRPAPPPEDPAT
jgi:hypothetical protein